MRRTRPFIALLVTLAMACTESSTEAPDVGGHPSDASTLDVGESDVGALDSALAADSSNSIDVAPTDSAQASNSDLTVEEPDTSLSEEVGDADHGGEELP